MRTIATAIESYAIDCNRYPPNPNLGDGLYVTPWRLTTPVAYLASRPVDPFKDKQNAYPGIAPALHGERWLYDYFSIISSAECLRLEKQKIRTFYVAVDASGLYASVANRRAFLKYGLWMQWSAGPDGVFWIVGDDFQYPANASPLKAPSHRPWGYSFDVPYDASNGTRSFGNLFRTQKLTRGAATDPEA
ncbi:MAG: hypothetical protein BWZ10_02654 [candidate division BRC1 bacterium ADurb.BinA364]|nr:MAG: hypothetical protein BWZ10_02654 [candidate division BRC1 bacterium ADurb.BinA364]